MHDRRTCTERIYVLDHDVVHWHKGAYSFRVKSGFEVPSAVSLCESGLLGLVAVSRVETKHFSSPAAATSLGSSRSLFTLWNIKGDINTMLPAIHCNFQIGEIVVIIYNCNYLTEVNFALLEV